MEYRIKLKLQRFSPSLAGRHPKWFVWVDNPSRVRFWSAKRTEMCAEPAIRYADGQLQTITGSDYVYLPGGKQPPILIDAKNIEKIVTYDR